MRAIGSALLAMTLMVSSALADTANAPLAAGKPAGVKQAQIEAGGVLLVAGILVVAGAIALVASTTQGNGSATTTNATAG